MKPYPIEFRQKIIEVYEKENISIRNIAQRFCIAKSFVQKIISQYKKTGDIQPRPQGGSPKPKLNQEQLIDLIEIIEMNSDATLEELCDLLEEKLQVRVSRATMGRITQKFNYTVKKKTLYAAEKKSDKVQQQRVEYWAKIREISAENLIFIDESGVNLAMVRLYARALKGQRARGEKPQKRGKNISLLAALSVEKVLTSVSIYGSVDGVTFEAFIRQKLIPHLQENACIVMDNAKIHQGEMVRELLEKAGAKLIYLSPYSPEFSPIENLWSKVKAILKKTAARNYKDLINGITDAMHKVTQDNIRNWFAHCCYCPS